MAKTKAKKRTLKRREKANPKHPTATYPRSSLKLPKGVDPGRKRAAPKKNSRRRNPDAPVAPAPAPAAPAPVPVSASAPAPAPAAPAPVPAPAQPVKNPGGPLHSFTWGGDLYKVGLNFGVALYRRGSGPWLSVREALKSRKVKPALRAHLKAAVHVLETASKKRAQKLMAKVQRAEAKAAKHALAASRKTRGKRNGAVEKAAAAALKAEKHERMLAKKRAGKKNAGRSCAKNPLAAPWQTIPRSGQLGPEYLAHYAVRGRPVKLSVFAARPMPTDRYFWVAYVGKIGQGQGLDGEAKGVAAAKTRAENAAKKLLKGKAKKNPTTAAKPKRQPTKKDFARIVKLFKKYVSVFSKQYPRVALLGLKVDPSIHDTERHFAMTGFMPGDRAPTVRIAPELAFEPVTVQRGIIIHEIAHSVRQLRYLPSPKGYDENERATDKLAEKVTGLKIYYDSRGVEVAGRGAKGKRPRPAGLR